ncbi:hypothetical protein FB45DRAFT_1063706 [Roridomyces roridus]|uniref:RING-type domain-containing protein n=1 Tax=Roridomyces roridus TaxID=1738132 RepID=A0AAD7FGF7_9AGAR|nr:hypothetical protein FB45DRAFT_1063706 [Roridomyces roridus]
MTVPTRRLARIGPPGTGISIAAVFGVEWVIDWAYFAYNAAREAWTSYRQLLSADFKRCTICDENIWGDPVSCSNEESPHWYCVKCFESTVTAMITGDVAFSCDPRTTLPLCCYCLPSASILDILRLSSQMRRSWEKAIIARQLQSLGVPLITCSYCSYVVLDERPDSERLPEPAPQTSPTGSLRSRLVHRLSSYIGSPPPTKPPERFHCSECDFLTCLPPRGCGAHFQLGHAADEHKCKTDDLRLEIERAVDKSLIFTCPSCSTALVKDGGCNHCTCTCGLEYCHICHARLGRGESSIWRMHFCGHFIETGQGRCKEFGCRRCPLYSDRDDEGIRRRVEGEVTKRWKKQRFWTGVKSFVGWGR